MPRPRHSFATSNNGPASSEVLATSGGWHSTQGTRISKCVEGRFEQCLPRVSAESICRECVPGPASKSSTVGPAASQGQAHVARHVIDMQLNHHLLSYMASYTWRAISARPIARHVIYTHVLPSFFELTGILYVKAIPISGRPYRIHLVVVVRAQHPTDLQAGGSLRTITRPTLNRRTDSAHLYEHSLSR